MSEKSNKITQFEADILVKMNDWTNLSHPSLVQVYLDSDRSFDAVAEKIQWWKVRLQEQH